ncbi:MAG TPA: aspartate aminotransferase family protein [Phycisphaerae bacterium]|nr:aspartate aminotransferase family protein [Phycisphaerae bacterium]
MAGAYDLTPRDVPEVNTKFRRIRTKFPVPESVSMLQELRRYEPHSMEGQAPVVWDRAEGFQVYDRWGNMWLDFSSGVLITNAGHGRKPIADAVIDQARSGLLTSYCFPSVQRGELAKRLVELAPTELDKAFILSTGSEATECALKLGRTHGRRVGGDKKIHIVTFENAFHGRTLGAQLAGGIPALKEWIGPLDPTFVQVPFPDGFRCEDTSFDLFEKSLAQKGVKPEQVACVMTETYQGGGASFAPPEYVQQLRQWCDRYDVVLIMDEVQAAFGRCGTFWGFEYYGIVPDLMCLGKGISSSLPVSAVVGRSEIMNQFPPGSMTSTHTGNPVCARAACANIDLIVAEKLAENAAKVGQVFQDELDGIKQRHGDVIGARHGRGLVAGLHCIKPGTKEPDGQLAWDTVARCVSSGVLFFSPVGFGGATIKICPPLCITAEAASEGCGVIAESLAAVLAERSAGAKA